MYLALTEAPVFTSQLEGRVLRINCSEGIGPARASKQGDGPCEVGPAAALARAHHWLPGKIKHKSRAAANT